MSFVKNVITDEALSLVHHHYSNHPRRTTLGDQTGGENNRVLELVNLKKWNNFNDTINIIFGDSHAEFLGRLFREVTDEMEVIESVNRTYCFWTGATTLIGSLQSKNYFEGVSRSIILILESLKEEIVFKKLNVIVSLGEIDVRTKLFIESFHQKKAIIEIIKIYCDQELANKLESLKLSLSSIYSKLEINVFFKSPPPPSASLPYRNPQSHKELKNILEKEAYPAFLSLGERKETHAYLIKSIKDACVLAGVHFLQGCYCNYHSLDPEMSLDGVHISSGEWALQNCRQIFLDL